MISRHLKRAYKSQLSLLRKSYFGTKKIESTTELWYRVKRSIEFEPFAYRHVGNQQEAIDAQLQTIKMNSVQELIKSTIPQTIINSPEQYKKFDDFFGLNPPSQAQALQQLNEIANLNIQAKCFYGCGYNPSILPPVIQRNVLQNPGWYTPYTPYQSQISQGRLQALFHYQSMIASLTSLHLSNASLLDQATALGEGVMMICEINKKKALQKEEKKAWVLIETKKIFPHLLDVLRTRAEVLKIKLIQVQDIQQHIKELEKSERASQLKLVSGVVTQNPSNMGEFRDLTSMVNAVKKHKIGSVVATDLLAACLYKPPGQMGFDIAIGSAQRFGIPMGYGGPHAGFIAYGQEGDMAKHIRKIPGRLVGRSIGTRLFTGKDGSQSRDFYRLALQTRETFIKQEKATSNICTAQALLANMSAFYAMYHGPHGLRNISVEINFKTNYLAWLCEQMGYKVVKPKNGGVMFDTVVIDLQSMKFNYSNVKNSADFCKLAASKEEQYMVLRPIDQYRVGITINETTKLKEDIQESLVPFFAKCSGYKLEDSLFDKYTPADLEQSLTRKSQFLTHPVFNTNHTQMEFQRFLHRLCQKDISLVRSMIPLGSCTLKLNAACQMLHLSWPLFFNIHPFAPKHLVKGYTLILQKLSECIRVLTGFDAVSMQPNSGSNGQFTGLLAIIKYFKSIGQQQRNVCIIPTSAHGTNPSSAALCGLDVVRIGSDQRGNTNIDQMKKVLQKHKGKVAAFMITYPSTHGVFEERIKQMCDLVHQHGGQVYMDGANMNAQLGHTSPGKIGADVCHLNLHKTFCIPHGGGGPGMGPIGVRKHLAQFLPGHVLIDKQKKGNFGQMGQGAVSSAPFGSPLISIISYMYITLMGSQGLLRATEGAILNANYMAEILKDHYKIVYRGDRGQTAHQYIIDIRDLNKSVGVTAEDVAKRLMDFGFHAPTLNWPIANAIMIQPTQSESKKQLDYYCQALIYIRKEIAEIQKLTTKQEREQAYLKSTLKNAPHCEEEVTADSWDHSYTREQAAFPLKWIRERGKFWPTTRIDNQYGDKHPVCGTHWKYI